MNKEEKGLSTLAGDSFINQGDKQKASLRKKKYSVVLQGERMGHGIMKGH